MVTLLDLQNNIKAALGADLEQLTPESFPTGPVEHRLHQVVVYNEDSIPYIERPALGFEAQGAIVTYDYTVSIQATAKTNAYDDALNAQTVLINKISRYTFGGQFNARFVQSEITPFDPESGSHITFTVRFQTFPVLADPEPEFDLYPITSVFLQTIIQGEDPPPPYEQVYP